jgi:hypothetical protein
MTENTETIVLEILLGIRVDLTELKSGQRDIQHRLTLVESCLACVELYLADHDDAYAE